MRKSLRLDAESAMRMYCAFLFLSISVWYMAVTSVNIIHLTNTGIYRCSPTNFTGKFCIKIMFWFVQTVHFFRSFFRYLHSLL